MRPKRLKSNLISESTKNIRLSRQEISSKSIKANEAGKITRKYRNKSDKSHVKRESLKKVSKVIVKNEPELQGKIIANYKNEIKNEYETNRNETSQNECNSNELSQQSQCLHCERYFNSVAGLRRHEISCSVTCNKSKKLERGRIRKKGVLPMETCPTSNSVTDRPEEIEAVNDQNNRCNGNPLINVSPSSVNNKNADGNKENEISESSNQMTSSTLSVATCKAEANGNISIDVDGVATHRDITYPNQNAISSQSDNANSDDCDIVDDFIVNDGNKNNEVAQHKCMYCRNVYKTFRGLRRHEISCSVTCNKSKKLERGRIRKKGVLPMETCPTSNSVTDRPEEIEAVNDQNNRCNGNPLINVSPSSVNNKNAEGNKENEISESSNQMTSSTLSVATCKAEANGNVSIDVDGLATHRDIIYLNQNAISSQSDNANSDDCDIVDDFIVNDGNKNNEVAQHKCMYCRNVYKTFRGLRRHEISCSVTCNKSKKLERGRIRKKGVLPMETCPTSNSVTDRPEEIEAVNDQNNRCNGNPLINVSPLSVNNKNADGDKENEISESSNRMTSSTLNVASCKVEANDNVSIDVDGVATHRDIIYLNQNAMSNQSDDFDIVDDFIVKDENKNNEVAQHKCMYCRNVYKTFRGLRRHESNCKKKSSLNNNTFPTDTKAEIAEPSIERTEPVANSSHSPSTNSNDNLNIDDGSKCHCCGEDKEIAHLVGDFECKDCLKLFRLKSSLERHIRVVHNGESHECPQCGAKSPDKGTLARHMYTHTGLKPYSCPVCKQEFSRKYHLVRHNMQTGCDGKEKPVFPCQVCGREFSRKDNLREHLRAHAGQTKRKKKYTCGCCGVECEATELLKLHKKIHNGERHYACDFCHKKFPSSGALKKHRRTHTGEKPYECITCHRWFAAKETLNRHIRLHTGYKPHCCPYCGKRFIQGTQLKAHLYYHTGQAGMPPTETFVCDLCGKKFNRKARLNEHVKFIHLGAKPFECEQCGKTFIRKEDLNRHQIIHSGIRAHQCPICSKAFTMKSSLKVHLLTHTKEPPSSCDECGRAFIRQDCLLRHMKTKHKEMLEEIKSEAEKKKLQQQLLQVAAEASLVEGMDEREELDENGLVDAVRELLTLLVDETTLRGLGWPGAGVEALLEAVIRRCGHEPAPSSTPRHDRLRHNIKLLFTVVIDDSAVKALLNNQTVDEVILHVLRLAKS